MQARKIDLGLLLSKNSLSNLKRRKEEEGKPILPRPPKSSAEWLAHMIKMSGVTNSALSDALGLHRNCISVWKNHRQIIPMKHAVKIAKILGVDPLLIRNIILHEIYKDIDVWFADERARNLDSISQNELEFLEILRSSGIDNPRMNDAQREKFKEFVKTLEADVPKL